MNAGICVQFTPVRVSSNSRNRCPLKSGLGVQLAPEYAEPKHQLVELLLLGREVEKDKLLWAIAQANNTKSPSLNLVRMFLEIKDPVGIKDELIVEHKGLEMYDSLIMKGDLSHGNVTQ